MKKNLMLSLSCLITMFYVTSVLAMPDKAAVPVVDNTAQSTVEPLSGKVLQTMDSGGYTYLHIQKKDGEKTWVAVAATPIAVGSQVTFKGGMEMRDFESKSLKRKFDSIIFADAVISDTPVKNDPSAPTKDSSKSVSGGSKAAVSGKDAKIAVAKATGANAYTVQEIFANSGKLNKKKVVVSGKVVKVSAGIMGKNWIHIQDGTGTQAKKNHNLVCTSKDMADVDDVVTISGVLAKDKDFGGGYKYNAIVEESTIKK
jgi:hypothetical protein